MSWFAMELMTWLSDFFAFFWRIKTGVLNDFQLIVAFICIVGFIGAIIDMRKPKGRLDRIVDWAALFAMIICGHWMIVNLLV